MNNWPTKKLGEVAKYINGKAFKPSDWSDSGLPIIRIQNLTGTQDDFNYYNGDLEKRYIVEHDDILLSWSASLGVYLWGEENAALNQHIFKVLPLSGVDKKYLFYILHLAVEDLKRRVHGSTMTHITKDVLDRVSVPVPPIEIQTQIVERLDKIAEAQKLNDKLIQKSDELFQSLLHQELKPAGKNWETLILEEVTKDISDGNYSSKYPRQSEFVKSGVPFVRANNFKDGVIIWDDMRFISTQKHKELAKGHLKVGDVLIVTRGETGNVAFVSEEFNDANINAQIVRINSENLVTNSFVFYILQTDSLKKQIRALTTGTTLKQLPVTNLRKIKIHLPSMGIQKQIVAKLSAAKEYKKQLLEQKLKLKELFESVLYRSMR